MSNNRKLYIRAVNPVTGKDCFISASDLKNTEKYDLIESKNGKFYAIPKEKAVILDTKNAKNIVSQENISKSSVFTKLSFATIIMFMWYAGYMAYKEINNQTKDVYKHPNIVVLKTPKALVLRDIKDNKERVYMHDLSAKTYFEINENDTVYFHALKNYNKKTIFYPSVQNALKINQKQR